MAFARVLLALCVLPAFAAGAPVERAVDARAAGPRVEFAPGLPALPALGAGVGVQSFDAPALANPNIAPNPAGSAVLGTPSGPAAAADAFPVPGLPASAIPGVEASRLADGLGEASPFLTSEAPMSPLQREAAIMSARERSLAPALAETRELERVGEERAASAGRALWDGALESLREDASLGPRAGSTSPSRARASAPERLLAGSVEETRPSALGPARTVPAGWRVPRVSLTIEGQKLSLSDDSGAAPPTPAAAQPDDRSPPPPAEGGAGQGGGSVSFWARLAAALAPLLSLLLVGRPLILDHHVLPHALFDLTSLSLMAVPFMGGRFLLNEKAERGIRSIPGLALAGMGLSTIASAAFSQSFGPLLPGLAAFLGGWRLLRFLPRAAAAGRGGKELVLRSLGALAALSAAGLSLLYPSGWPALLMAALSLPAAAWLVADLRKRG